MMPCLFCKIIHGELPANRVFENDVLLAFHDIAPVAPTHIIIIPKLHIATINDLTPTNAELIGQLILTAKQIAITENIAESGYRLVFNVNQHANQTVYHIHLHLLGQRQFSWPPG